VLPAAVMRSAPFLLGAVVFVAESVGFRAPLLALPVCCEGLGATVTTAFEAEAEDVVELDWVMAN